MAGFVAGGAAAGPVVAVIGGILTVLAALIGGGGRALESLATATRVLAAGTHSALRHIYDVVRWVFVGFLGEILTRLRDLYARLRSILERVLGPVLRILRIYRDYLDWIVNRFVLPVLNLIQRLRQILALLRLLHLKFAERLDRQLLLLQQRIAAPFEALRRKINEVINTLYLVLDPLGLFQPAQVLIGLARTAGELVAIIQRARLTVPAPPAPWDAAVYRRYFTPEATRERAALHRQGRILPEEAADLAAIRRALAALTGAG